MDFKELRKKKCLTAEYVAKSLKIKVDTYRKYECYARLPSATILTQMTKVYNCSFADVMNAYQSAKEIYDKRYKK